MSGYNLKLREREEKIQVKEIVERFEEGAAGLPGVIIRDQKGRTHTLMALDFTSFDWKDIGVGSVIAVRIKEEIKFARHLGREQIF